MSEETASIVVDLADEAATRRLGEDLALAVKTGDCLALRGDLGAGKSTLARALLRAMAGDDGLEVPSPTFTLVQLYELRLAVAHFDLYRLGEPCELDELGFDEALDQGLCLVEWPERAETRLPSDRLDLSFVFTPAGGRRVTISGPDQKLSRIRRSLAIRQFLVTERLGTARRRHLTGDASSRAYETVAADDLGTDALPLILMDAPKRANGPPIRDGKPYSQLVHLAEDVLPFVALADGLRAEGFSAPAVVARDLRQGLLLLEDLGRDGILDAAGRPIPDRYAAAAACLAHLHGIDFPRDIAIAEGLVHRIPDFDRPAMLFETELLLDWHIPWKLGRPATEPERQDYLRIWNGLVDLLEDGENGLVLRDYHSPNILWRAAEIGVRRVGLIDFQDAMIGPCAYDLGSLVQDARVTIDRSLMNELVAVYVAARSAAGPFDRTRFDRDLAIMSAQRNCKLAGLWVRLLQRDGKPGYMQHMPRSLAYLSVAFEHEALAPLREWCANLGVLNSN